MSIGESNIDKFNALITAHTGLFIRPEDGARLASLLTDRARACQLSPETYVSLMSGATPDSDREWSTLASLLTVGESYFFRDEGQFRLIQDRLLPEIIERNQSHRTLRLWSAGCSTGEEPYSLAILIDRLLPHPEEWHVTILGADLNPEAIDKARRGLFENWSFRGLKSDVRARYFSKTGGAWQLDARIRTRVTWLPLNLLQADYPDPILGVCDMDLILCRNVFIYFDRQAVVQVIRKLANTLRAGGYLITGHAELGSAPIADLRSQVFEHSVVYQRHPRAVRATTPDSVAMQPVQSIGAATTCSVPLLSKREVPEPRTDRLASSPPAMVAVPENRVTLASDSELLATSPEASVAAAQRLLSQGDYGSVVDTLAPLLQRNPRSAPALHLTAKALANMGLYDRARSLCEQAVAGDTLNADCLYLLAQIYEIQGDRERAKETLRKVIYVAPDLAAAYLDLAELLIGENEPGRAQRMRRVAFDLLQALAPEIIVEPYGTLTAGELLQTVRKLIAD